MFWSLRSWESHEELILLVGSSLGSWESHEELMLVVSSFLRSWESDEELMLIVGISHAQRCGGGGEEVPYCLQIRDLREESDWR